jgi:serine/threonine protein kinase
MNDSIGYYGRGPGPGPNGNRSSFPNQYGFDSRHPPQNQLPPMQAQPPPAMKEPLTYFQMCIPRTRTIAHYKRIEQIGEGTYGQVYKATCLSSSTIVALKKIRLTSVATEGLPRTVIREIKILKALKHENMVQMMEVVSSKGFEDLDEEDEHKEDKKKRLKDEQQLGKNGSSSDQKSSSKPNNNELTNQNTEREKYKGNLFLVLEYISHDLSGVLDMGIRFTPVQSKCIFRQLLSVLQYMHEKRYVHRDLKSSNILIDERYRVKLADFGLARSLDDE